MLASATITYDIADLVGNDFDARRTKVWVSTNVDSGVISDTVGNQVRVGDGLGTIAEDGTGSVSVWVPGTGSNPTTWQTYLHFDYAQRRPGGARERLTFGPFTVTADANLADLIQEQEIPPTYLSEVTTALTGFVDDAEAAKTAAQAARDAAVSISGISTSDGVVEALVKGTAGAGPLTRAALGTEATAVNSPLRMAIGERATKTTFYDDFTGKAAATVAVGGSYVSSSGHTVNVTGQLSLEVSGTSGDRRATHTRTNTATAQSTYLSVDVGTAVGDLAGYIYAEFEVPAGADAQQSLVLIAPAATFGPPNFNDCAAHCAFTDTAFRYDSLQALGAGAFTTTILGRGQYTALTPGTYRAEVSLDGTRATVTDPRGKRWAVDPSAFVLSRTTSWLTLQLYNNVGVFKALKILRWGAEVQQRAKRGSYTSAADLGAVATQPGRVLGAMQTSGASTATAMTTSLSAKLFSLTIPIPVSRRVLCEGFAWFDESVPVAASASALLLGVYLGGGTTYGKLSTIQSGFTPANNTVDASAFASRQGTMTSYARGRLFPFAVIIDIDPAFTIGDLIEFQVKAQASATSLFTFIDSGSASGGTSTLRRSTFKITELAAS